MVPGTGTSNRSWGPGARDQPYENVEVDTELHLVVRGASDWGDPGQVETGVYQWRSETPETESLEF